MTEPVVVFDHVSKTFDLHRARSRSFQELLVNFGHWRQPRIQDDLHALQDVSFTIERGETVGFIGANGAGKSTLLKLIARILEPDSGTVSVNGRVGALLELGAGFHPELTGRENVYLNASIMGLNRREVDRRFDEIVAFSELERFIDVPVKHYSSGMHVRLGFAVAVNINPEILLIDEVLAVGDQAFQHKCLQHISGMKKEGVTIVLVSHDLGNIVGFCERVIWLKEGAIYMDGTASEVADQYMAFSNETYYRQQSTGQSQRDDAITATQDGSDKRRWGTRQAEIVKVELLNAQGESPPYFETDESLRVRVHYQAPLRIYTPAFGLAFYRNEGTHINGPNSVRSGCNIAHIEGCGYVDYFVKSLPLNPGSYELTVAIYNHNSTVAFDHHHRMYSFDVRSRTSWMEEGVVHIDASWEHTALG